MFPKPLLKLVLCSLVKSSSGKMSLSTQSFRLNKKGTCAHTCRCGRNTTLFFYTQRPFYVKAHSLSRTLWVAGFLLPPHLFPGGTQAFHGGPWRS